jgi:8-oxo-dGTP pyrophosphatase MutT (NUDIX family)
MTHSGGIVFRLYGRQSEYLLIRPKKNHDEWVFPKGHIEPGEGETETAIREVEEETGVVAEIVSLVGQVEFDTSREHVTAVFFLMEFVGTGTGHEHRETRWAPFEEALEMLTHESNRNLLRKAEGLRKGEHEQ